MKFLKQLNRPAVFAATGLLCAALFVWLWHPPALFDLPMQTYDTPAHLNMTKKLLDKGVGAAVSLGFENNFYPPLFHAVAAGWATLFGGSIVAGMAAAWLMMAALIFPLGMLVLAREILRRYNIGDGAFRRVAYLATPLLAVGMAVFPYNLLATGTLYAFGFGMGLVPFFAAAVLWWLRAPRWKSLLTAAVCAFLICLAQPRVLFSAGLFLAPFALENLIKLRRTRPKCIKKVILFGSIGAAVIVALLTAYVAVKLNKSLLFNPDNWFAGIAAERGIVAAIWDYVAGLVRPGMTPNILLATLVICAIVICGIFARRVKATPLLAAWEVFGVLFVLASSADGAAANLLTAPWYKNSWRIGAILPMILVPLVLLASNFVYEKLKTQRLKILWLTAFGIWTILALVFNPPLHELRHEIEKSIDIYASNTALLTDEKQAAMREIARRVAADDLILSDPFTGSGLLYGLADRRVLFPIVNPHYDQVPAMSAALAGFDSDDQTAICRAVELAEPAVTNYYFLDFGEVYLTTDPIYHQYDAFHRRVQIARYVDDNFFREVDRYNSGQGQPFVLYEINCQ
jgi:hypothetical protein